MAYNSSSFDNYQDPYTPGSMPTQSPGNFQDPYPPMQTPTPTQTPGPQSQSIYGANNGVNNFNFAPYPGAATTKTAQDPWKPATPFSDTQRAQANAVAYNASRQGKPLQGYAEYDANSANVGSSQPNSLFRGMMDGWNQPGATYSQGQPDSGLGTFMEGLQRQLPEYGAPEYNAPEFDQDRVDFYTQQAAAPGRSDLRAGLRAGLQRSGAAYDNPNVVDKLQRGLYDSYGQGLSRVMGAAGATGLNRYTTSEYNPALTDARMQYQTEAGAADREYNVGLSDYNSSRKLYYELLPDLLEEGGNLGDVQPFGLERT